MGSEHRRTATLERELVEGLASAVEQLGDVTATGKALLALNALYARLERLRATAHVLSLRYP